MKCRDASMNLMSTFLVVFVLSFSFFPQKSFAIWPVIDISEIAKTGEVIEQLQQQYSKLQEQYETLQNQYNSTVGQYGWGNWNNSDTDLTQRQWTAPDWKSALNAVSGGNPGRYQQLVGEYQQDNPTMKTDDYAKGADKNLAASYENQVKTNQASGVIASYEFNDMNEHLKKIKELGQQIESGSRSTGLKSAVDLNSRVQLEVAYISAEEVRMQSVLNQQMAADQAAQIASKNEASQYNQAGENP